MESYRIYKYGYRPHQLVYTGYVFTQKKELHIDYKKAFKDDVKEEFKKCIRKDTIFKYKLSSFEFKKRNIDWKVFSKASISLYDSNLDCYKDICVNKKYYFKSLPNDFNNILEEYIWEIELNTSLDIDYINMKKVFNFALGSHKRLGEVSIVSLLNYDIIQLIINKC